MSRLRHPIRQLKEPFGKAGLTVAILALVLALVGGAYAAGGLTKSQEKQVTKIAKKYAGKPGAAGPAGPQGPAGAAGANGKDGAAGAAGKDGTNGQPGTNGKSVTVAAATGIHCPEVGGVIVEVAGSNDPKDVCNGVDGPNGANATFEYLFNSATSGDPTSKKLALNNAAPGSATQLLISETNNEGAGVNIAAAIKKWVTGPGASGTLMIRKASTQSTYAEYSISANKDEGAFDALTVKFISGNGTFANEDPITVQYFASASPTLPPGGTETGTWALNATAAGEIEVPISFSIPIKEEIFEEEIHFQDETGFATNCPGSVSVPKAAAGHLCVYHRGTGLPAGITFNFVRGPSGGGVEATSAGAFLNFEVSGAATLVGSWAVGGV
jgi:hypothetical protein